MYIYVHPLYMYVCTIHTPNTHLNIPYTRSKYTTHIHHYMTQVLRSGRLYYLFHLRAHRDGAGYYPVLQ